MKKLGIILGLFVAFAATADDSTPISTSIFHEGWNDLNKNGKKDAYEDPAKPIVDRVNDLLKQMTLNEKIGQLWQGNMTLQSSQTLGDRLRAGEVSSFLSGATFIEKPETRNQLQHIVVEQSRLGVPLIFGHDAIHGFRTVFPIPLAQACA